MDSPRTQESGCEPALHAGAAESLFWKLLRHLCHLCHLSGWTVVTFENPKDSCHRKISTLGSMMTLASMFLICADYCPYLHTGGLESTSQEFLSPIRKTCAAQVFISVHKDFAKAPICFAAMTQGQFFFIELSVFIRLRSDNYVLTTSFKFPSTQFLTSVCSTSSYLYSNPLKA